MDFIIEVVIALSLRYFPSCYPRLTTEAGNQIFTRARDRVFRLATRSAPKYKISTSPLISEHLLDSLALDQRLVPVMETSPKWSLLQSIVQEIKEDFNSKQPLAVRYSNKVMIFVKDELTSAQLRDLLIHGADCLNDQRYRWFISQQVIDLRQKSSSAGSKAKKQRYGGQQQQSSKPPAGPLGIFAAGSTAAPGSSESDDIKDQANAGEAMLSELGIRLKISWNDFARLSPENKLIILEEQRLFSEPQVPSQSGGGGSAASVLDLTKVNDEEDIDTSVNDESSGPR